MEGAVHELVAICKHRIPGLRRCNAACTCDRGLKNRGSWLGW